MKKNKGFTLIELLLTLCLVLVVISIVYQLFTSQLNNSKESAYKRQINTIKQVVRDYHLQNLDSSQIVTVDTLTQLGLIDGTELIDPRDGSLIGGCIKIQYNATYKQYDYVYEESLEKCQSINETDQPDETDQPGGELEEIG